jgi:hypothetical protein
VAASLGTPLRLFRGLAQLECLETARTDRDDVAVGFRAQRVHEGTTIRAELLVCSDARVALFTSAYSHIPPSQYCATDMLVFAIRIYEPWTWSSILGGLALLLAGAAVLIVTNKIRNR